MKRRKFLKAFYISAFVVFIFMLSFINFSILFPLKYKNYILKYSNENKIEASFIASVIKTESRFDKNAVSSKGAIGLMQLLPSTAKWIYEKYYGSDFDEKMLFDPEINIRIGTKFLYELFEKYNDKVMVLACYNAGEKVAKDWLKENSALEKTQIKYKETQNYVSKVLSCDKIYKIRLFL